GGALRDGEGRLEEGVVEARRAVVLHAAPRGDDEAPEEPLVRPGDEARARVALHADDGQLVADVAGLPEDGRRGPVRPLAARGDVLTPAARGVRLPVVLDETALAGGHGAEDDEAQEDEREQD